MPVFRSGNKNSAFKNVRSAYKPIRQGNPTQEQGTAFANLRDQNSSLLDKGINRMSKRGNRLTSQIRDLKSQQRTGAGDFSQDISVLKNRRKRVNKRRGNMLDMQAYQAPTIEPQVEPENPAIDRAKEMIIPQFDWADSISTRKVVEPEDVEGSLMYQNSLKEGLGQVDAGASARGFGRSPAAVELRNDFQQELLGRERERQQDVMDRQWAEENRTKLSQAGQLMDFALGSGRLSADQSDAMTRNKISLLNTMLGSNAFGVGAGAAGDIAGNYGNLGNSLSSLVGSAYPTVHGGGGGSSAPFVAPFPGSPDFSGANTFDAGAGASSANDWLGSLVNGIAGFL